MYFLPTMFDVQCLVIISTLTVEPPASGKECPISQAALLLHRKFRLHSFKNISAYVISLMLDHLMSTFFIVNLWSRPRCLTPSPKSPSPHPHSIGSVMRGSGADPDVPSWQWVGGLGVRGPLVLPPPSQHTPIPLYSPQLGHK